MYNKLESDIKRLDNHHKEGYKRIKDFYEFSNYEGNKPDLDIPSHRILFKRSEKYIEIGLQQRKGRERLLGGAYRMRYMMF